jgi:hypothetical protein
VYASAVIWAHPSVPIKLTDMFMLGLLALVELLT